MQSSIDNYSFLRQECFCCKSKTGSHFYTDIDRYSPETTTTNALVNPHRVYSACSDAHQPVRSTTLYSSTSVQEPRTFNWHNQQSEYQNNFLGAPRNPISVRNYSQTKAAEVTTAAQQKIKHIQPKPADIVPKRNLETTSKNPTVAKNCSSVALVQQSLSQTHCGESSSVLQKTAIKQLKSKLPEPIQKEVVKKNTATVNIVTQHEKSFHPTDGVVHVDRKKIPNNSTTKTEKENSSRNEVKYCFGCSFCAMR